MVQKIIGDKLMTDRQQTTDNRQQTDIFELTPIHMENFFLNFFFFFFCIWEGENEWGEIYTSLLATQVRFAHLLRSQGDDIIKILIKCQKRTYGFWQLIESLIKVSIN
jgi:hypothetical protein